MALTRREWRERRSGSGSNCLVEDAGDVDGLAADAVADLVAAAGAVGDDQVVARRPCARPAAATARPSRARRRWSRRRSRTRPAMPQQLDSIGLTSQPRHGAQHRLDRAHRAEGLLVAVAVQMRDAARPGPGRQDDVVPGARSAASSFLEQERRLRRPAATSSSGSIAMNLVAEGQEAGGLEPDDARALRDVGRQRVERAPRLRCAPRRPGRPTGRCARSRAAGRRPAASTRCSAVARRRAAPARRPRGSPARSSG